MKSPARPLRSPRTISILALSLLSAGGQAAAQVKNVRVEGYVQSDARAYPGSAPGVSPSTFLIRRARLTVEGTVANHLIFQLAPDIGQGTATLAEATVGVRFGVPATLRIGLTKPRIGLEPLQRSSDLHLVERGLPAYLVPSRDIGVNVGGTAIHGVLTYDIGLFNGVPDYGTSVKDAGNGKDLTGRIFVTPFAADGEQPPVDFGIGVGASSGTELGTADLPFTSTIRTPGQITFFEYRSDPAEVVVADGRHERIDPQAYLYTGPLGLLAEYAQSRHHVRRGLSGTTIGHRAWQVVGTLLLTGERAGFGPLIPKHELLPEKGDWGAVELAARIEGAEVDDAAFPLLADATHSARRAQGVGVGVSWYFARRTKLVVEYERTTFRGGAATGDRPVETFLAARLQVSR